MTRNSFLRVAASGLAFLATWSLAAPAEAQRIFVVHAADVDDEGIGKDCRIDAANMQNVFNRFPAVRRLTQYVKLAGNAALTQQNILGRINSLPIGQDDAVMFYYSGHGAVDENNNHFCILPNDTRLYLRQVSDLIAQRGARLNVVIADMCSVTPRQQAYAAPTAPAQQAPSDEIPASFRTLFLESRGTIILCSSSASEVAVGDPNGLVGGLFTSNFTGQLIKLADRGVDWNRFFDAVRSATARSFEGAFRPRGGLNLAPYGINAVQQTQTAEAVVLQVGMGDGPIAGNDNPPDNGPIAPGPPPRPPGGGRPIFGAVARDNGGDGVLVVSVAPGGPAEAAGLEPRDIILSMNGEPVGSTADYTQAIDNGPRRMNIVVRNWRDGQAVQVTVTLNK